MSPAVLVPIQTSFLQCTLEGKHQISQKYDENTDGLEFLEHYVNGLYY